MMPDQAEVIQAVDSKGCKFWVPVQRDGNIPVISIVRDAELGKGLAARACMSYEEAMANKDKMTEKEKAELLQALHRRLAHAKGRRLYLTLKKKRRGGDRCTRRRSVARCSARPAGCLTTGVSRCLV
jgi:hypothetical protein